MWFWVRQTNRVHFRILAVGIPHQLQAANLPCLAASLCLIPSFCLSQRWNVNHAPTLGLCPKGKIQLDCPGSTLSMYCSIVLTIDYVLIALRSCPLRPSDSSRHKLSACLRQFMPPSSTNSYPGSFWLHHTRSPSSKVHRVCAPVCHKVR